MCIDQMLTQPHSDDGRTTSLLYFNRKENIKKLYDLQFFLENVTISHIKFSQQA